MTGLPPLCPLRLVAGVPCPSCGLTRATRLALAGDLAGATRLHPLWLLATPYAAALLVGELTSYVRTGEAANLLRRPFFRGAGLVVLVVLVMLWIARFFGAFGGPVAV